MTSSQKRWIAAAASTVIVPLLTLPAFANENTTPTPRVVERKQTLTVNVNGLVNLNNGEVTAVAADSFKVKVWGIEFNVKVAADTKLAGGENTKLADFKVGDRIKLVGKMTGALEITARNVHNYELRLRQAQELKAKREAERKTKAEERQKKLDEQKAKREAEKKKREEEREKKKSERKGATSTPSTNTNAQY